MDKAQTPDAKADVTPTAAKKVTLAVDVPVTDDTVLCEVCGHENSPRAALCAMCSNYLR